MVLCNRWICFLWLMWFCRIAGVLVICLGIDALIFENEYYFSEWTLMVLGVIIYCGSAVFWVLWNDRLSLASTWVLDEGNIVIIRSLEAGSGRKVAPYIAEKLLETRGEANDLALAMASKSETPLKTYNIVSGLPVSNDLARLESKGNIAVELGNEAMLGLCVGLGCLTGEFLANGIEGRLLYAFLMGIAMRLATLLMLPMRKRLEPAAHDEIDGILSELRLDEVKELIHFGFVGKSAVRFLHKTEKERLF